MKQRNSAVIIAAVFTAFTAANALAQVRPGMNEVNLNGNITAVSPEDGDTETTIQLQVRYGHFLTSAIQLGAQVGAVKLEDIDTFGEVGAFAAYHFGAPGSVSVPYAGAQIGTGFGFDDNNPFAFGGFAGLKYFLGQSGAISPELFISRSSVDDSSFTSYGLRVGVSVFFGAR